MRLTFLEQNTAFISGGFHPSLTFHQCDQDQAWGMERERCFGFYHGCPVPCAKIWYETTRKRDEIVMKLDKLPPLYGLRSWGDVSALFDLKSVEKSIRDGEGHLGSFISQRTWVCLG